MPKQNRPRNVPIDLPRIKRHPFRRAVLRGIGLMLPPLLTLVIFLWVGSTIQRYILQPVTAGASEVVVRLIEDIPTRLPGSAPTPDDPNVFITPEGERYQRLSSGEFVPTHVFERIRGGQLPQTGREAYRRYVQATYLQPAIVFPLFICLFVMLMYLLGSFLAAGIGRVYWSFVERGISRLPLVRNVYSSVKQVTDFMFNDSDLQFTRVVAVEFPRKGVWALALVTSEGLRGIEDVVGEPTVSILVPTSPMPMTGWTAVVAKSETVDLDITIDQALQYVISCGVVIPPQQLQPSVRLPNLSPRKAVGANPGTAAVEGPVSQRD